MTDADDLRLHIWAESLLRTLWGRPSVTPPAFLRELRHVLREHEQYILARAGDPAPQPGSPVPTTDLVEDDVTTLLRWMHDGEWVEQ